MATLANKDAAIVHHHPRVKEGKVPEHMLDLALSSAVRPINDLDNVFHLKKESTRLGVDKVKPKGRFKYI